MAKNIEQILLFLFTAAPENSYDDPNRSFYLFNNGLFRVSLPQNTDKECTKRQNEDKFEFYSNIVLR